MPRVSALRIVDRAILPSVVIIATKVLSIFVASLIFQIDWDWSLSATDNNFLIFQYKSFTDLSAVVNLSDTAVVLICGLGLSWTIFQANHLNINKTHPTLISKIYNRGKEFWLTTTGQVYHHAAVWLGLSWLVFFVVLVDVYQGLTSAFVLGIALVITLGLTFAFYNFVRDG